MTIETFRLFKEKNQEYTNRICILKPCHA